MKIKHLIYRSLGYRLQNLSSSFKSLDIMQVVGKLKIRGGNSDIRVFKQIFLDEVYHFFPENFNPKVIIDAGANVGYSAIWFASRYPESKIFAIEPESGNFDLLTKNTLGFSNIFPMWAGLWHEKSFLKILGSNAGSWAFETRPTKAGEKNDVATVTIPQLIEDYKLLNIDLLKIDIEGSEFELFSNHAEVWLPLVKMIMIETHDRIRPGCSQMIDQVVKPFGFLKFTTKELSIFYKP